MRGRCVRRAAAAAVAVLAAGLASCAPLGSGGGSSTDPEPSQGPPLPAGQATSAADVEQRLALFSEWAGTDEVVGVGFPSGYRLLTRAHDRTYLYRDNENAPRVEKELLLGDPFPVADLDLEPLMAVGNVCGETPQWTVRAHAYDMRTATNECDDSGLWTLDGDEVDVSTDTAAQVEALATQLPRHAPEQAHRMSLTNGPDDRDDALEVAYADPDRGSVTVGLGFFEMDRVKVAQGFDVSPTFPVDSVDLGEVVRCGQARTEERGALSWTATVRATRDGDLRIDWSHDQEASPREDPESTDLSCHPVG